MSSSKPIRLGLVREAYPDLREKLGTLIALGLAQKLGDSGIALKTCPEDADT